VPILERCEIELGEIDPDHLAFSYWEAMGKRTPDVILRDKSVFISIESKLGSSAETWQLVEEYEDGMKVQENFWLIAVTADYIEPTKVEEAKNVLREKGYKDSRIKWINWQQIYAILRTNAKSGNETEQKLIGDLLSLLKAKGLSVFTGFEEVQLSNVATLWPKVVNFLEECSALFGTLSSRLHQKNITCIEKGYTHEVVQTGYKGMGLQASAYWLPRSIAMRAWDNDWKEKEASQGLLMYIRLSPLELEVGYRLGFWQQNLKPMFIEAVQSCALAEKLRTLGNCSVSYYGRTYEMLEDRVVGDSLTEEVFSLEALRNVEFVIIGRVFNHEEMASPKLLDEIEECLVHMRDLVNQNGLYFTKQTIDSFTPRQIMETTEDNGDKSPDSREAQKEEI